MFFLTYVFYRLFKLFPRLENAARDASSLIFYETLDRIAMADTILPPPMITYEDGPEPELEQEP